ncbi:MAG: hypothetical protein U5K74_10605 [Gemmatimonadaceae bacterium]|nr:hypothetical protein [Gemmatimonadaceae bacterium]
MWEIVADDNPLIGEVNRHLQGMQGKLLRPALVLLANAVEETRSTLAIDHAAVVELITSRRWCTMTRSTTASCAAACPR